MLSNEEIAGIVQNEISTAQGSDQDDIAGRRSEALDYYFGRLPGNAPEGRSSVVSHDVSDMVEALLAQIMPTFTGDNVAKFEALNPQDEQQAQIESDAVNYHVMQKSDGYVQFYQAVKDALLQKNGIIKVYVDEWERVRQKELPPLDEAMRLMVAAQYPGAWIEAEDEDGTLIKWLEPHKKLCVEAVAPEDFLITSDQRNHDVMDDCEFCAQRRIETEGSLIEQGYPPELVAELPTFDNDTQTDSLSRNQSQDEDEHYWFESMTRPIRIWECYIRMDADEDGYPELRRITLCNQVVLDNEVVDWAPFATGTGFINPHRWLGISVFDKIKTIQDQKTQYLRQYDDNMRFHNNRRLVAVEGQANMGDVVNSRPGGVVRVKSPDAVQPIPVDDIGPSCITAMNYLDKQRSERAGASLDMQSEGVPTADTAHGTERQMSFKEQMAGMITRTLSETLIKQTYLLVHRALRAYFPGGMQFSSNGNWQQTDPAQWGEREQISLNIGLSQGERFRQANALLMVINMQKEAMQFGFNGVLTDAEKLYNAATDYCRMQGLDNPQQYFVNPASPPAQQAAQASAQASQAQAQEAQAMQQRIVDIEQFKAMSEAQKDVRDYEYKVAEALLNSELEQAKIDQSTAQVDEAQRTFEHET